MFEQQATKTNQPGLFVDESPDWGNGPTSAEAKAKIREHEWVVGLVYAACDVVCWVVLYGFVSYVRRDAFYTGPFEFFLVDLITVGVILQALYIIGGYNRNTETRSLTYTAEHILAVAAAAAISSLILYSAASYQAEMKPSRGVLLISFMLFLPISLVYRRVIRHRVAVSTAQRAFLVIGGGELAARFYEVYKESPNQQRLEFVDDDPARVGSSIAGNNSPVVQGDLASKLAQLDQRYSGVILAKDADALSPQLLEQLVRTQFQRTRVYTLESFYEAHWRHVPMHTIDPFWPLQTGFQLARTSPYHYLKRLFGVIASGVLLVICSPLIVLITCAIWVTSGRPAIFGQRRIGQYGQAFIAYKFRTMTEPATGGQLSVNGSPLSVNREDETSEVTGHTSHVTEEEIYTRENDSRVTRLGRLLRKLRLDELPQLWNVFKGDMSLIGPRAEWFKCVERYEKKIPFYHFRHLVKPGITGWAQVNYPYGESEEDAIKKLQYDLYYIRHYSLKLDAMIVLKTVHTMLFGKGR
jgi:exopolysaccharide biosynthesis polyprenyl glycosylphosphotransferase